MYNQIIQGKVNFIINNTGKVVTCVNVVGKKLNDVTINQDTGEPTTFNYGYKGEKREKIINKVRVSVSYTKWEEVDIDSGMIIPKGSMKISVKNEDVDIIESSDYIEVDENRMFIFGKKSYGFGGDTYKNYILLKEGTKTKYDDEI